MIRKLAYLCVVWAAVACKEDEKALRSVNAYFSVDSLLDVQATQLAERQAKWVKTVTLDGTSETDTLALDQEGWQTELALLSEFDLNKPHFVGAYAQEGNAARMRYVLKPKEKAPVQWLQIARAGGDDWTISGSYAENKTIYQHTRLLDMKVSGGLIESMEIKGVQAMIFKDSIHYTLRGYVLK